MICVSTPLHCSSFSITRGNSDIDVLHITKNIKTGPYKSGEIQWECNNPRIFEVDENSKYFTTIDGVLFSKDKKTLVAFPRRDEDFEYTIPDGVTRIGEGAFEGQKHLTSMIIPDSIEKIDDYAFIQCTSLKELKLPASLKKIGINIFYGCPIERLSISESNEYFSVVDNVLFTKNMQRLLYYPGYRQGNEYHIPDGVRVVEDGAFWDNTIENSNLKILYLPKSLKNFGYYNCWFRENAMESFIVNPSNRNYVSIDGVLYTKDLKKLVVYPQKKKNKELIIPEGVEEIEEAAFCYVPYLQKVKFPTTLRNLVGMTFVHCIRFKDYEGLSDEIIKRMCLTKQMAKTLGLKQIQISSVFLKCPVANKFYAMREQIRLDNQNKE